MLPRFNPIPGGLFWGFFIFTYAFEDMRWKHATCSLHKHFRSCSYIYDEIVGFRWGCGEWGGLFPTFHFWKFSLFLPITDDLRVGGVDLPPPPTKIRLSNPGGRICLGFLITISCCLILEILFADIKYEILTYISGKFFDKRNYLLKVYRFKNDNYFPTLHFWKFSLFLPITDDLRVGGVDLPPPPNQNKVKFDSFSN